MTKAKLAAQFLIICLFTSLAAAQTEKRVSLPKGKTTATFKGKLPANYADYDAYIVRARKGQTITVKLVTEDAQAYITVFETKQLGPTEDLISTGEFLRAWSGKAPITSEYSVQVYGARTLDDRSSRSAYSLEISVK